MDDKTKLKNSVLSNLRAVLLSVKGTCSLKKVAGDYNMLLGEEIPFKKLGYKTLLDFVTKENAFKIVKSPTGEVMVDATPDAKSAHIVDMITKQKTKSRGSKGRTRSRRFAPVQNTVSTSNRIPSSQNNNWKPKALTPVKSARRPSQQSSSNRNRRQQRSVHMNIASDRLKALQIATDNHEHSKETIVYKNSKPKENNEQQQHQQQQTQQKPTAAITKRQQSFVKQQSGGGDNNEINNKKSVISRENSNDSTTINNNINKIVLSRQSSSNNETVVDLLKNVPKELLRDVPFDNTDITFNDILDRTSTTILNNNNNKFKQLSPSSSIISNTSNTTSTSATHDDDSSIYSTSELIDVTDHTSSNSSSPTTLNDTTNNKKWSPSVPSSILVSTSRGRGRLVRPLIQQQPQSPTQTQDEQIYQFNQFNTKQFADSLQTATPTVVNHVPKTKLLSEKQLCDLMNELQLDYEIEYKVIPRPHNHAQLFNAQIKIGHHVQCSTWPDEFTLHDDALDAVFKKAIIEVNKQYSYIRLPISSINVIGDRLRPLIAEHPTGIWNDTIEKLYTQKYNERLPTNWLCLANKYGIATECAPNEKFILTLMEGYEHPSTILPASLSATDEIDLNNSISAPILPTPDDNYLSVVITCTNSTTDIAFRIIGTPLSERYRRLTVDMEKYYNKENIKPIDLQKISAGNYYAVSNNNTWMRVRVLEHPQFVNNSADDLEILCSFIDHGHEYPINVNNLHELPYTFRSVPAQAIHCSLVGLEEFSETEIALPYLEDLIGKHLFLKVFEDIDTYGGLSVVLFDTTSDEDVNINISIMEEVCKQFIKTLTHNEIKEMNIVYADENGYVYLFDINTNDNIHDLIFIDLMEKLRTRIEESIFTTKDVQYVTNCLNIHVNDEHLYLAKFTDGSFYRCKFIELNQSKNSGTVLFIDYGNTLTINFNVDKENLLELSSYSHVLLKIPPQCIKARLHYNVPKLPSNIGEKLMKIINTINDQNQSILVKVLVPAGDKPFDYLPVVELFTRKCTQDDKSFNSNVDNNDVDINTLYSINKVLGLLMRE
ncbi:tudor domain-containing protein 7-like [Chrysoperla carnea]|uniref:tudor domain-containing protein 7-like n=1 Tax=Chrysoperla carnea TaxID=189513 RepID=UPI001D097EF3|nr:tudor domain-containing protein 7-like [Chrysoperla carnea]